MSYKHTHIPDVNALTDSEKYRLSVQLGGKSALGFYQYYFNDLKYHRTQYECFNHVNTMYFEIYGEYRYETYQSFANQFNRHYLKKKQ